MNKSWPIYRVFCPSTVVKVYIQLPSGVWYWIANYLADSDEQREQVEKEIDECIGRVQQMRRLPFFG